MAVVYIYNVYSLYWYCQLFIRGQGRAIALKPHFLVLNELTSALDSTIQAQIIDLLKDLQQRLNMTYLFISHDLRVVKAMADEVSVMLDGKIVEHGPTDIFDHPEHPYTKKLFSAAFELR